MIQVPSPLRPVALAAMAALLSGSAAWAQSAAPATGAAAAETKAEGQPEA